MSANTFSEFQSALAFFSNELAQKPELQVLENLISYCLVKSTAPEREKQVSYLSHLFLRLMDAHALSSKDELDHFVFHRMYPLDPPPTKIRRC